MVGIEHAVVGGRRDPPEQPGRAGADRQVERGGTRGAVDDDRRIADAGEGKTLLADLGRQLRLARDDGVGVDRIVRGHAERLGEVVRLAARRRQPVQRHALEPVEFARCGIQHDERSGAGLDSRRHARVVIALAAQQAGQQVRVLMRAAIDLRGVGRVAVVAVERGQRGESLAQ